MTYILQFGWRLHLWMLFLLHLVEKGTENKQQSKCRIEMHKGLVSEMCTCVMCLARAVYSNVQKQYMALYRVFAELYFFMWYVVSYQLKVYGSKLCLFCYCPFFKKKNNQSHVFFFLIRTNFLIISNSALMIIQQAVVIVVISVVRRKNTLFPVHF